MAVHVAGGYPAAPWTHRPDWREIALRTLDVLISALALFFLAPLFVVIALLIRGLDPGPVFYAHKRVGRGGHEFGCLKFRTMVVDSEDRLRRLLATDPDVRQQWDRFHKLSNDPRITPFGRFLRRSSLDEIPQLLNVLVGEMSLVGPRPIVRAEACRYGRHFRDYCSVRPGVTGLWQVLGRNRVSYERRVAMDVICVRRQSIVFNLAILAATVPAVLLRKGAE
jgi:lipopolysaccharide/colanic/teichoic acid biosynthesis glycosyltransferase